MNPKLLVNDFLTKLESKEDPPWVTLVGGFDSSWLPLCYQLRHHYFVQERGWVNSIDTELEIDRYDEHAEHIAVFEGECPIAYLRVLPCLSRSGWMLDQEFSSILSDAVRGSLERKSAVELSRLVVAPHLRHQRLTDKPHAVEHLLKSLYQLALGWDYERFYIVVEAGWPQVFARRFGLLFRVIGEPYIFPDETRTVAAVATLRELEAAMKRHSTTKYEWYRQI